MKRLIIAATGAVLMLGLGTIAPAQALGCPPTCAVAGVASGSVIQPNPNQLDFVVNWTIADVRPAMPAVRTSTIRVVATLTPVDAALARGTGYAYVDHNAFGGLRTYPVNVERAGSAEAGAVSVKFTYASADPTYMYFYAYAFSADLTYTGLSSTKQYAGAALEILPY